MNISILTLFPELYEPFINASLIKRAREADFVNFDIRSLFSFCLPNERVDGPTYGHTPGMVIRPEIVEKAFETQEKIHGRGYKIFLSPHGNKLDQNYVKKLAQIFISQRHVIFASGRYEGMDVRIEEIYADEIISIGDYVLMGGDIPTMVVIEAILRLVPGVVGKQESIQQESFSGPFVDYPEYTAPVEWKGQRVPEVLRSGNHKAIADWREHKSAERTVFHHFDWLRSHDLSKDQKLLISEYIPSHYAVIMHSDVLLPGSHVGTTSVTSFDIHDIARSAKTYGLKNYFIVTPLEDQLEIVKTLLDFWHTGPGLDYNIHRVESMKLVKVLESIDDVIADIVEREKREPIIIGTAARSNLRKNMITYYDQEKVWAMKRPVLLVFGTGRGLGPMILDRCNFILEPLYGFSDFNHLSVRSAAGIVFDRWLGINPKYFFQRENGE